MRNLLTAAILALLTLGLAGSASAAADDVLAPLREATYITGHDVHASLPHGDFVITGAVVCSLPGLERRWGGMLIGDVDMQMNHLPSGPGVLDVFQEMHPGFASSDIHITQAYLVGSFDSGITIQPSGYATAVRTWDELTDEEREQFTSIYLQCYSDGFLEGDDTGGMGGSHWAGGGGAAAKPEVKLRDPEGKEVYAAMWDDSGQRYDYRVNKDGSEVSIKDYYRGVTMFQYPWAPEEGDVDDNVVFSNVHYNYNLFPAAEDSDDLDQVVANVIADLEVNQDADSISIVSAPWMKWDKVAVHVEGVGVDTKWRDVDWERGGEGQSPWMLEIKEPFAAGTKHTILLQGKFEIPRVFSAFGYGGVYRFDTTALWTGEDRPVDIQIDAVLPGHDWEMMPSGDAEILDSKKGLSVPFEGVPADLQGETLLAATWHGNTRDQMIAATKFPMRELTNDWGTLDVYAPQELIDTVDQTEYVAGVGDMMEYYTSLWGDWRGPDAHTDRQTVFLLPDESGVQAFEDAGFVFILGGSRTGIPLVAHEVAHLWWGQGFSAPRWFQEGMANYGAAKFLEYYREKNDIPDPEFYRRYIMNFSLGHELPLSLERRDELDDSAAIYHNSAGFLLTADARLPYGLDGKLKRIYEAGLWQPHVSHEELREIFNDQSEELGKLWTRYVEKGEIDTVDTEDDTYREMVHTPQRDKYVKMLNWLTPAYMKSAIGDYPGAIFCAEQALQYRAEPKDYYFIANLTYESGDIDGALERATALAEREDIDPETAVKNNYLFAKIYRDKGDTVNERAALEYVVQNGPAANVMYEVREAQARLDELNGQGAEDSGAGSSDSESSGDTGGGGEG